MKKILLLSLLFINSNVFSQNHSVIKGFDMGVDTFNLETYNKNKDERGYYEFCLDNGVKVLQYFRGTNSISEKITKEGDPYSIERIIDYSNDRFVLDYAVKKYKGIDISINDCNKFIFDSDFLFNFSIENLIQKIKKEYNADLEILKYSSEIIRRIDCEHNQQPLYTIYISPSENSVNIDGYAIQGRLYNIDGKTGKTLKIIEKVFVKDFITLEQREEKIDVNKYALFRKYEMNDKYDILKITEYKISIGGWFCGLTGGLIDEMENDHPINEVVIYEKHE